MYPYTTPDDVRTVLLCTLEIDDAELGQLALNMWRRDLDPKREGHLITGLQSVGLDPDDFGIGR